MQTVVHVTHEAIQKIGGIGAVLQGLLTSNTYLQHCKRNILVGPFWPSDERGEQRLGPNAEVLYSSMDSLYRSPLAAAFREIEQTYQVGIVYGRRKFIDKETGVISVPEILLFDVSRFDPAKIGEFKFVLWEKFGIDSSKYDSVWDYEQYMGMPTALAAVLEGDRENFRTIFYAHECATMRRIVEGHAGHDTMFYNVLRTAMTQGHYVEDVFGDQSAYYKHSLVKAAKYCDAIFAVGDYTLKEIRFLGPEFVHVDAQIAYNGVPCGKLTVDDKMHS